jgi:hypothetical protein
VFQDGTIDVELRVISAVSDLPRPLSGSAGLAPDPGRASCDARSESEKWLCLVELVSTTEYKQAEWMSADEAKRFLAVLTGDSDSPPTLTTLCLRTLQLLPASGASLVLMSRGHDQGLAGASGESGLVGQDLEFTLGQGPGVDAYADGKTVLVEDLGAADGRWPLYSPMALDLGIRSVCALPLQVGSICLGVLSLYGEKPGVIALDHLTDAHLVSDLITHLVIGLQSETSSESIAFALDLADYRAVVHQATGMISAQLDCSIEEALVRLRGHAFAAERPIDEIAELVVQGSIRFDAP